MRFVYFMRGPARENKLSADILLKHFFKYRIAIEKKNYNWYDKKKIIQGTYPVIKRINIIIEIKIHKLFFLIILFEK